MNGSRTVPSLKWTSFDWTNGCFVSTFIRYQSSIKNKTEPYWGLYSYDLDFNEIDCCLYAEEFEETPLIYLAFQTDSYIFGIEAVEGTVDTATTLPNWYIDKADIGTGELKWKRWEPEG